MVGRGNEKLKGCVRRLVAYGRGCFRATARTSQWFLRRCNRAPVALLLALPLAACVTWVKPGTPPEVRDRDLAQCQSFAYSSVPPDLRTVMTSPGFITPSTEWCVRNHHYAHCRYMPGYYVPPDYASVDVNESARSAQVYSCMSRLGYVLKSSL
jgi:hypothetical protein